MFKVAGSLHCQSRLSSSPPSGFEIHTDSGRRLFTLYRRQARQVIVARCFVPTHRLRGEAPKPMRTRGRGIALQSYASDVATPFFSVFVQNASPFTLEFFCACVNACLCVEGLVVHDQELSDELIENRPRCAARSRYRGPLLSQRKLADYVCDLRGDTSEIQSARQLNKKFFDPYVNPESRGWCGHIPVHTCSPSLVQMLADYLNAHGVDDSMAQYVYSTVLHIRQDNLKEWSASLT